MKPDQAAPKNGAPASAPPAKVREVAAGVYQVFLPLPMRPSIVNVYLVTDGDEWALIDTGMHTPDSIAALTGALDEVGCPREAVRKLISTHHHADHFGTSQTYQELTGAEVYLNEMELARVERLQSTERSPEAFAFFQQHGIPLDSPEQLPTPGSFYGSRYKPAVPDRFLADGESVFVGTRELRVVWTPGHTQGHCCLYLPQDKIMIVGDHLLPKITPHVGVYHAGPDNPLQDFLDSQEKIQDFDVALVLPAHGRIFSDHRHRAKQIIQHHDYRLKEMRDLLHDTPRSAYEVAAQVFDLQKADLPIFHVFAATFETLAHLHLLMYAGTVRRLEDDAVTRFVV